MIEQLKQQIIDDYIAWVEMALEPLDDHIGIRNIAVDNFILKINKLCEEPRVIPKKNLGRIE